MSPFAPSADLRDQPRINAQLASDSLRSQRAKQNAFNDRFTKDGPVAVRTPADASSLDAVLNVVLLSARDQMVGIQTLSVVARMSHDDALGHCPKINSIEGGVDNAMQFMGLTTKSNCDVAVFERSRPFPAARIRNLSCADGGRVQARSKRYPC